MVVPLMVPDAFQSTLPLRGVTPAPWEASAQARADFNPHSPCGE